MKKKITVIIALICIMSMLVVFVACDKGNVPEAGVPSGEVSNGSQSSGEVGSGSPSGNVSEVNQIQQFRTVMTAVLNEFSSRLKNNVALTSALSVEVESGENDVLKKPTALKEIYDYMDAVEGKESVEDKQINEYAIRNFIAARTYGELVNQICQTDEIFQTPIMINGKENTLPSTSYAVILSEGTHIIAYLYGYDEKVGECVYKWDIDYISDSQFSAKMITMSDGEPACYIYGDTDGESISIWGDSLNKRGEILYKASDSDDCYSLSNFQAVEQCFAKVKSEFDSIDFEYLRSLKDACQNTASQQQYDDIADALCKQYGID